MEFILYYSIVVALIFLVWLVFIAKMYQKIKKKD